MASQNRPARLNRVLLALTGLVLLAVGAFTLLLAWTPLSRVLPAVDRHAPLLPRGTGVQGWVPYLAIVVAVFVGLACLRWLLAQTLRRPPTFIWRLPGGADTGTGTTDLAADIAADAVAADIAAYRGVAKAGATLAGPRAQPELHLLVSTEAGTDIGPLRERITTHALPRLRAALELEELPTDLLLRLDAATPAGRMR
jgi:hypothetical protein